MNRFNEAIELLSSLGKFKARHLAERAGVSRQAAHRELRLRVSAGELEVFGNGRGTWYERPEHMKFGRGDDAFWPALLGRCTEVVYRRVTDAVGSRPLRSSQAERLVSGVGTARFVFIDFEGVEFASPVFLRRLFFDPFRAAYAYLLPINCNPAVREELRWLERMDELVPHSDYGT